MSLTKNNMTNPIDINLKAKELCNKGICVSMSQARRLVSQMTQEKLDKLIQKKLNKKGEIIEETK